MNFEWPNATPVLKKKIRNFNAICSTSCLKNTPKQTLILRYHQGRRQKIFQGGGGAIRIEPESTTKNGRIFEIS